MPTIEEKPRPRLGRPPRRVTRGKRKTHNVSLLLNADERDALDRQIDRYGVAITQYFRGLIWAVDTGQLTPEAQLFRDF